jgi:hypothetical protein
MAEVEKLIQILIELPKIPLAQGRLLLSFTSKK